MCLEAGTQCGWVLSHIPKELRTLDICVAAVKNVGAVLEYVPEGLQEQVRAALAESDRDDSDVPSL